MRQPVVLALLLLLFVPLTPRASAQNARGSAQAPRTLIERFGRRASVVENRLAPVPLRSDIDVTFIASVGNSPIRIARDPVDGQLYVARMNGDVVRIDLSSPAQPTTETVYRTSEHGLSQHVLGMDFAPNGDLYLLSNFESSAHLFTLIKRGRRVGESGDERAWTIVAQSDTYLRSRTAFDHKASALTISPDGAFLYYNSGSRTDHGEEHEGVREQPLTAIILRIPTTAENVRLPNDRDALREEGYLFAEGIRNHFDLAFSPDGDLFGTENSGDRDDHEEINWLREGHHYGFPWRIGTTDTPMQFAGYDRDADPFVTRRATAWPYFYDDPEYPEPPEGVEFTDPILNLGPDADRYRDPATGTVRDASEDGVGMRTLTAHRSPLGLVFDSEHALAGSLTGDGFFLSWTGGSSSPLLGRMDDEGEDLHHLELSKVGENYEAHITRIVSGFQAPIDAVMVGSDVYVLEYGSSGVWRVSLPPTTTAADRSEVPSDFSLHQNYPNPFNPATRISFELPRASDVTLTVHDALGREIRRPVHGTLPAGRHDIEISLENEPSGVYFYRIRSADRSQTRTMVLAK